MQIRLHYANRANLANPVNHIDPDGRQFVMPLWGVSSPILISSSSPLLGAADLVKVNVKAGTKTGVPRVAIEVSKTEGHHIIPRSLKSNEVIKSARDAGFKFEGKGNKLPVEKFNRTTGEGQHAKHPRYTEQIRRKLNKFENENPNFSPEQALKKVTEIATKAKSDIKNNPKTKIIDMTLKEVTIQTDNTRVVTSITQNLDELKKN